MKVQFEDGKAQMDGKEVSYSVDNDVIQIGDYDYEANVDWTELNNDSTDNVIGRYDLIDYNQNAVIDSVYVMYKDGEIESISDTMDDYTEKIKVDIDEDGKIASMTFHTDDGKEIVVKADMDIGGDEKVLGTSVTIDNKPAAIYDFNPLTYEFKAVVAEENGKISAYEFKRDDEDKFYLPKNVEYQGETIDTDGVNEEWTQRAKEEFESSYKDVGREAIIEKDDVVEDTPEPFSVSDAEKGILSALDYVLDDEKMFSYVEEEESNIEDEKKFLEIDESETHEIDEDDAEKEEVFTIDRSSMIDETGIGNEDKADKSTMTDKTEEKEILPDSLKEIVTDGLKEEYKQLKEKIEAFEKKPELFRTDTDKANLMKEVVSFITKNFDTSEIRSMVIDKKDPKNDNNEKRYKDENVKVSTSEGGRERYYDVYKKDSDGNLMLDRREVWDNKEKYISRVENYREDARLDSVDYMNKSGQNYLTVNYGEKDVEGTPYEKVESVIERRFVSDEKDAMLKSETEYGKGYKETTFFRKDGRTDKVIYLENPDSPKGFGYVGKESYDKDGKVEKSEFDTGRIEKLIGNMESGTGMSLGSEDKEKLDDIAGGKSEDVLNDIKSICNGFDTSRNGAGISNDKIEYTKMITSVIDKLSETLKGVNGEKFPPREVERREDILQKLEFLRNNVFETKDDGKTYVEKFEKTRDVLESGISKGIKEFNEVLEETKSWMNDNSHDVSRTATASVDMGQRSSGGVDRESPNTITMEKAISNYLERVESIKDNDAKADDSKYQGVKAAYEKYVEAKEQYKSNVEYINSTGLMANKDFFVQFDRLKVAIAERNLYMEAKANPDIAKEMGAIGFKDDGGYLRNIFIAALAVNNANPIDAIILRGVVSILDGLDPLTKTSVFEKEEKPENMTKGDVLNSAMTDMANLDKDEYEKFEKDVVDTEKQEDVQKDVEKGNDDNVEVSEANTDIEEEDDSEKTDITSTDDLREEESIEKEKNGEDDIHKAIEVKEEPETEKTEKEGENEEKIEIDNADEDKSDNISGTDDKDIEKSAEIQEKEYLKEDDIPDYVDEETSDMRVEENNLEDVQEDVENNEEILKEDGPEEKSDSDVADKEDDESGHLDTEERNEDSDAEELYNKVITDKDEEKVEEEKDKKLDEETPDMVVIVDEKEDGEDDENNDNVEISETEANDVPTLDDETEEVLKDSNKDKAEEDEDNEGNKEVDAYEETSEQKNSTEKSGEKPKSEDDGIDSKLISTEDMKDKSDTENDGRVEIISQEEKGKDEKTDDNNGNAEGYSNTTDGTENKNNELDVKEIPKSISEMLSDYIGTDGGKNDNCVEFSDILNEIKDNGFKLEDDFINIFSNVFLDSIGDGEAAVGDGVFSLISHVADEIGTSFLGLADQVAEALEEHGELFYDSLAEGISLEYAKPGEDSQDMAFSFGDMEYRIEMDGDHVDNILTIDTSTDADGVWGYPMEIGMDTFTDAIHDICRDEVGLEFADNVTNVAASMVEMTNGTVDMDTALQMVVNDMADDIMAFGDAAMDESMYQQLGLEVLQMENIDIPEADVVGMEETENDVDMGQDSYVTSDIGRNDDWFDTGE